MNIINAINVALYGVPWSATDYVVVSMIARYHLTYIPTYRY